MRRCEGLANLNEFNSPCSLDYLPTLASILGYVMPDERPIDGENVLALLRGKPWQRTKFIPFASQMQKRSPKASIIQGDHKLLLWMDGKKPDELYHLHKDSGEQNNLAQENPQLAASLKKNLEAWLKSARHSYEKGDWEYRIKYFE